MARNQRLNDAIRQSGMSLAEFAHKVGVDPKTALRWITTGRLPRPAVRQQAAQEVGVPEAVLWPDAPGVAYGTSELVGIYGTRRELPAATVGALLDGAEDRIDILAYSALWLWDTVPDFVQRVQLKIAQQTSVRICLGDPDSQAVLLRGQEEGATPGSPIAVGWPSATRARSITSTAARCASAKRPCTRRSFASITTCF